MTSDDIERLGVELGLRRGVLNSIDIHALIHFSSYHSWQLSTALPPPSL